MVIIGGIVSLVSRGLDGGVEFTGGRTYRVEFTEMPGQGQEDLRAAIASYSINEEGIENISHDYMERLEEKVRQLVIDSVNRAKENYRRTVMGRDV